MMNRDTLLLAMFLAPMAGMSAEFIHESPSKPAAFGAEEIKAALAARGQSDLPARFRFSLGTDLEPEGFAIEFTRTNDLAECHISAPDDAGLMYGGLEVAEVIQTRGLSALENTRQNPYMALRGTKFNIPLDLRTPSYTDPCDAAQINMPEMWELAFWRAYIDSLARYRYNFVSLWSLHPFPSMVQVPGYEDVALADVWRSKSISSRIDYPLRGMEFVNDKLLADVDVIRTMTIDDKIAFWREVMAYGKSRNVDFFVVTWNIFDYGVFGKHGITDRADNPVTTDYFRKSVEQMFLTYPDLAGIGLTTGENMHGLEPDEKEDWALATYGQGTLDAAATLPDRHFTFVHRQHETGAQPVAQRFKPLMDASNIEFLFSFKYAKAHVMSAVKQPYHPGFTEEIREHGLKTIWTLRNDSNYHFRWGAPDFVRTFIQNIPHDISRGYYYGSDGFTWGRNFLQRKTRGPRPIEIDHHWFHWMLWGRLGYNPDVSNDRLKAVLAARFGLKETAASNLFDAWQSASMIYPTVTGFHWGWLDFMWNIESCQGKPSFAQTESGFHDVNRFISLPPHPHSGVQSIPDFVKGDTTDRISPMELANRLEAYVLEAEKAVGNAAADTSLELTQTREDIRIMAALGRYYTHKIRGATALAQFRATQDDTHQARAIEELRTAALAWKAYAERALKQYKNPLWTNRVGMLDWKRNYTYTLDDIRIAGGDPAELGLPPQLEAENEPITRHW